MTHKNPLARTFLFRKSASAQNAVDCSKTFVKLPLQLANTEWPAVAFHGGKYIFC